MSSRLDPAESLRQPDVLSKLAEIEHERWAHWQRYVHESCRQQEDGSLVIPAELVQRWERQIATPFSELSQDERDSDIEQVERYLPAVIEALE